MKAAEPLSVQPHVGKALILIGQHDGDCALWVVHVECAARREQRGKGLENVPKDYFPN